MCSPGRQPWGLEQLKPYPELTLSIFMNATRFPLSTISLIRHGRPDFWQEMSPNSIVPAGDLPTVFRRYDESGILSAPEPPERVVQAARSAMCVYSSDLKRSRESVRMLGVQRVVDQAVFRELELPIVTLSFLRLPIFLWLIILRGLWFRGYAKSCESVHAARARSAQAARILQDAAQEHGSVALVGHGFLNRFIKHELLRAGWEADGPGQNTHWGMHQVVRKKL